MGLVLARVANGWRSSKIAVLWEQQLQEQLTKKVSSLRIVRLASKNDQSA